MLVIRTFCRGLNVFSTGNLSWNERSGVPVLLSILWFLLVWVRPSLAQDESLKETETYRQAIEKLGGPSIVRWTELGSTGLDRWDARRIIDIRGVVVEWDQQKLGVVRPDGNGVTNYPGDGVIGIEPGWKSDEYEAVHMLFVQQRFEEVLTQGQNALKLTNIPRWQQRLMVAEMVQSAASLKKWGVAGRIFGFLIKDDPPNLLLSAIPLPWSDETLIASASVAEEGAGWIENEAPAMQLLGAGWLLGGEQRGKAIEILKGLSKADSEVIAGYAKAQLWRTVPPSEIMEYPLPQWLKLRDSLPLVSQAGPTMLLGTRLEQAGQHELAIGEFLRIATLFGDRYHLKQKAVANAVDISKAIGDNPQADRINRLYPAPGTNRVPESNRNRGRK